VVGQGRALGLALSLRAVLAVADARGEMSGAPARRERWGARCCRGGEGNRTPFPHSVLLAPSPSSSCANGPRGARRHTRGSAAWRSLPRPRRHLAPGPYETGAPFLPCPLRRGARHMRRLRVMGRVHAHSSSRGGARCARTSRVRTHTEAAGTERRACCPLSCALSFSSQIQPVLWSAARYRTGESGRLLSRCIGFRLILDRYKFFFARMDKYKFYKNFSRV